MTKNKKRRTLGSNFGKRGREGVVGAMKTIVFDYDISKDTPASLVREIQADVLKDEKLAGGTSPLA